MFSWQPTSQSHASDQKDRVPAFDRSLDAVRRGESEALGLLDRPFLAGVFGYMAARMPDRATTEDLTSEVFLKMVEGIGQLRASDEAVFVAWLLQIAQMTVAGYSCTDEKQPPIVPLDSTPAHTPMTKSTPS